MTNGECRPAASKEHDYVVTEHNVRYSIFHSCSILVSTLFWESLVIIILICTHFDAAQNVQVIHKGANFEGLNKLNKLVKEKPSPYRSD